MQTELKLPPSGRDFQVYERVVVQTASTRDVAKEFSLSQTRVRQIVKRVAQWLLQELPTASEAADAAHLRLSQHMAADRLEGLFCEAMTGWRARHETKYFGLALRVITLQSKMPVIAGTLAGLMADAIEGPLPEEHSAQPADYTPAPPEEDCSPAGMLYLPYPRPLGRGNVVLYPLLLGQRPLPVQFPRCVPICPRLVIKRGK
jgi:hypothetical protein